jgi:hypothetical protein
MLVWGQSGDSILMQEGTNKTYFYEKDTNKPAMLELIIICKRRHFQSMYIGIYTKI